MSYDFECTLCKGVFDGKYTNAMLEPPDKCPVCRAPKRYIVNTEYAEQCRRINAEDADREE